MARSILSKRLAALAEDFSPLRFLSWTIEGSVMLLFWGLCRCLPVTLAARFGALVIGAAGPHLHKHRQVVTNLTIAMRGAPVAEIESTARAMWRNFGMVLAEYPHLRRIARDRFELEVAPGARAVFATGKRMILVTAHMANWEVGAAGISAAGARLAAIYSPQSNPVADWAVHHFRSVFGATYLPKDNAMRAWLKEGETGRSLGLIVDQRVDGGSMLPFFGVAAETVTTPARLAARLGCPLVPFRTVRIGLSRYRVCFEDPVAMPAEVVGRELAMTEAVLRRVEAWIQERPAEWLCSKRRWPKQRNGHATAALPG